MIKSCILLFLLYVPMHAMHNANRLLSASRPLMLKACTHLLNNQKSSSIVSKNSLDILKRWGQSPATTDEILRPTPIQSATKLMVQSIKEDTVTSIKTYLPEAYDKLNLLQQKVVTEQEYEQFVKTYTQLDTIHIKKFTYHVDGQDVVGFLLHPRHIPTHKKLPLVICCRGGFNGEGVFYEWAKIDLPYIMRHFAFYAQNGYAVLASQYRGADGNKMKDEFGGADVNDVLKLFDVAQDIGFIDLHDVSFSAFSRGNVMACRTLKLLHDRSHIRAYIGKGSIVDLHTFLATDPKYIKPILEQARPDFHQHSKAICDNISVVCWPEVLKGIPTLLMHNTLDNVVPAILSENLAEKLKEQGSPYMLRLFPGKHHQILEYNDEVQRMTLDWLAQHKRVEI